MAKIYYEEPTQVKFWDVDSYIGGIAYHEVIICGCCGATIDLQEYFAEDIVDPDWSCPPDNQYIIAMPWIDVSEAIIGE